MEDMELVIRERAYHLWMAAGSPDGNADAFWLSAQREILATSLGAIADVTSIAADAPSAEIVKKPARKAAKDKIKTAAKTNTAVSKTAASTTAGGHAPAKTKRRVA